MFLKRMQISFWRHKSKQAGKAQLYCRIIVDGERVELGSTGLTIWADHWDGERISHQESESFFKNEQLDIMRNQIRAIYNELFRKKEKITAEKIKRAYLGQTVNVTLVSAFQMYLQDSAIDQERDLEKSTLEVYDNVRKKLIDFLLHERAADLLIEDFDLIWVKKFRRWMKQLPQADGRVGHKDSYIIKHTQTIKNVMIWAKLHKLSDHNPLEGLRIKGPVWDDPVYLTNEQFEKLRSHTFSNKIMQQTADVFIILCRCGFHYGDLEDFVKKSKTAIRQGVDGKNWIMKNRIKTEVAIRVPVFEEVEKIVEKYGGWEKLPMRPPQKFNFWLKLVAAELGLPEDLSSKAGRKTFTDWCFNTLLLSTDAVKVLLGRKSASGLDVYGKPDERRVAAELEQSQELKRRKKDKKQKE